MSNRSWIIFGVVVLGFFGAMFALSQNNKIDLADVEVSQVIENTATNGNIEEHVYGKKDSKVVLVEYADYQCSGCASMNKRIKVLSEEYKDQIAVVFRNFTLDSHPNALSAAAAVESASLQGKFWEMNALVFENQVDWANSNVSERNELYMSYARELDLDEDKFKEGMKSSNVRKKIEFDKATARKAGLTQTPFFLLNGEVIDNGTWGDDDKFRELINKELKKHDIDPPKSTTDKK